MTQTHYEEHFLEFDLKVMENKGNWNGGRLYEAGC
jgi:hypothetical protein